MSNFPLPSKNVRYILIGLIVMIAGYILMIGPAPAADPDVFRHEMFDFRRIVLSPALVVLGIVIIIIAIMRTPGRGGDDSGKDSGEVSK